jgi:hypothetical protein
MKGPKHLPNIVARWTTLKVSSRSFEKERRRRVGFYALRCCRYSDGKTSSADQRITPYRKTIDKAKSPGVAPEFYGPTPPPRLITVCAWCNRVRNNEGFWQQATNAPQVDGKGVFSHGICPECAEKSYNDYRLATLASSAPLPSGTLAT